MGHTVMVSYYNEILHFGMLYLREVGCIQALKLNQDCEETMRQVRFGGATGLGRPYVSCRVIVPSTLWLICSYNTPDQRLKWLIGVRFKTPATYDAKSAPKTETYIAHYAYRFTKKRYLYNKSKYCMLHSMTCICILQDGVDCFRSRNNMA